MSWRSSRAAGDFYAFRHRQRPWPDTRSAPAEGALRATVSKSITSRACSALVMSPSPLAVTASFAGALLEGASCAAKSLVSRPLSKNGVVNTGLAARKRELHPKFEARCG